MQPHAPDELLVESDSLVETGGSDASPRSPAVGMYRALSQVTLSTLTRSGSVNHDELQQTLACSRGNASAATHEPALKALLSPDEIALLDSVKIAFPETAAAAIARAASLPSMMENADAPTALAVNAALEAYRHASLLWAWQTALAGNAAPDVAHERDASAVQLISVLRPLLDEG
jgi:hypothetical protein